ncbi:MAG: winged helix-turn-helix domain-containing protein [Acidobacteria bacterium]|nr:winged helix-turn-helix domain-containing protein [Acidobacteriota bacterium]
MNRTAANGQTRRVARFGVFELDVISGELRKAGVKIKLQARSFQILKALLEVQGAAVTREELRRRLWPDETFVDFESGLNTAINRLRLVLRDSAENPRYIETLARTGYRFIFPCEQIEVSSDAPPQIIGKTNFPSPVQPANRRSWLRLAVCVACLALLVLAGVLYVRWPQAREAKFHQITFGRGQVWSARFAPGGQGVLYTAQWETGPRQMFFTSSVSPESRPLGFLGMSLASVSSRGELALLRSDGTMNIAGSTLLRVPLHGGAPLEVDRNIMGADWSADGSTLAVVRATSGANQLEFPIGKVLYRTSGWLSHVRISPDNTRIAFLEHPVRHDDSGGVKLVSTNGSQQLVSDGWTSAGGVAWLSSGKEIWFTAARKGAARSLWAITPSGKLRPISQAPGVLTLRDVAPDGRVLITSDTRRLEMAGRIRQEAVERNLSWLDWSRVQKVSADGGLVLFDENGEGAASESVVYIHYTDGGSTVRVGEGRAMDLSPNDKTVLTMSLDERTRFRLLPLAGGPPRDLPPTGLQCQWARFFPDGRRLLVLGNKPGKGLRLYVQSLENPGAPPAPITPEMVVRNVSISPDGQRVAVLSADGKLAVYPTSLGEPQIIPASEPLAPVHWSQDGQWLFVLHRRTSTEIPARVSRIQLSTGQINPWKQIAPPDRMGVTDVTGIAISRDERSYVYSYRRVLSELYLVAGW